MKTSKLALSSLKRAGRRLNEGAVGSVVHIEVRRPRGVMNSGTEKVRRDSDSTAASIKARANASKAESTSDSESDARDSRDSKNKDKDKGKDKDKDKEGGQRVEVRRGVGVLRQPVLTPKVRARVLSCPTPKAFGSQKEAANVGYIAVEEFTDQTLFEVTQVRVSV